MVDNCEDSSSDMSGWNDLVGTFIFLGGVMSTILATASIIGFCAMVIIYDRPPNITDPVSLVTGGLLIIGCLFSFVSYKARGWLGSLWTS